MVNHLRSFFTSPRSAAKTPSWQVTEDSTSTVVFNAENGIFSFSTSSAQSSKLTARKVKYIAKSAEKNINSLDSQIMVPTETIFGRSAADGTLTVDAVLTMLKFTGIPAKLIGQVPWK